MHVGGGIAERLAGRKLRPAFLAGPVLLLWGGLLGFALFAPLSQRELVQPPMPSGESESAEFAVAHSDRLREMFADIGYRLQRIHEGDPVPRIYLQSLPADLPDATDSGRRKDLFLRIALPLVLRANEVVAGQRRTLLALKDRLETGGALGPGETVALEALAREYGVEGGDLDELGRRVDEVPVSIALAQAGIESGWGTSRFAQEGRAIFGQWTSAEYAGLVPARRDEEAQHKVRSFDRLLDSARSYLRNLNTHGAYAEFRRLRAEMRAGGFGFDVDQLVGTLGPYAEKTEYVDLLRSVIETNTLLLFDSARLKKVARDRTA